MGWRATDRRQQQAMRELVRDQRGCFVSHNVVTSRVLNEWPRQTRSHAGRSSGRGWYGRLGPVWGVGVPVVSPFRLAREDCSIWPYLRSYRRSEEQCMLWDPPGDDVAQPPTVLGLSARCGRSMNRSPTGWSESSTSCSTVDLLGSAASSVDRWSSGRRWCGRWGAPAQRSQS